MSIDVLKLRYFSSFYGDTISSCGRPMFLPFFGLISAFVILSVQDFKYTFDLLRYSVLVVAQYILVYKMIFYMKLKILSFEIICKY